MPLVSVDAVTRPRFGREPLRARTPAQLADVVQALGSRGFGPGMAAYADAEFGGHVCFAHHLADGQLTALAAGHVPPDPTDVLLPNMWRYTEQQEWKHDRSLGRVLSLAEGGTHAHFHDIGGAETKRHWPWEIPTPLVDKLLLCERKTEGWFVLEFSRWGLGAGFSDAQRSRAVDLGPQLMALTVAHRRLLATQRDPLAALRSAEAIERCLAETTDLSRRERQVCALHLLGAKTVDVGVQLGIGLESAKSYRKRAYLRMGIAHERELLLKVLSLSARWHGLGGLADRPDDPQRMGFLQAWRD